jgi:hypothetical protein
MLCHRDPPRVNYLSLLFTYALILMIATAMFAETAEVILASFFDLLTF